MTFNPQLNVARMRISHFYCHYCHFWTVHEAFVCYASI